MAPTEPKRSLHSQQVAGGLLKDLMYRMARLTNTLMFLPVEAVYDGTPKHYSLLKCTIELLNYSNTGDGKRKSLHPNRLKRTRFYPHS